MIIKRISCKNRDYITENCHFLFQSAINHVSVSRGKMRFFMQRESGGGLLWKFVKNRNGAPINNVTVFLRKYQNIYLIMSCHCGKQSERLPYDDMALEENNPFWENHALVWGAEPACPETVTTINPWTGIDERNTLASLNRGLLDSLG